MDVCLPGSAINDEKPRVISNGPTICLRTTEKSSDAINNVFELDRSSTASAHGSERDTFRGIKIHSLFRCKGEHQRICF
jgi:hypothetical protein